MQSPSVGRIVHYRSYGTPGGEYQPACRAAVVTEVQTTLIPEGEEPRGLPLVGLCVLNPEGQFFNRGVPFDQGDGQGQAAGGTWHWPEQVP